MRRLMPAVAVAALAAAALADDKVGKTPAPNLLAKSVPEIRKLEGYHFKYSGSVGEYSLDAEGTAWKSGLNKLTTKNGVLMYRRGTAAFAQDKDGKWVGAASLGQEAQAVAQTPLPDTLLAEALENVKKAKYLQDEEVDGKECKVIECEAPTSKLKEYIKNAVKYFRPEAAAMAERAPIDEKESFLVYRVFVSKEDLVVRRVVREANVVLPESVVKQYPGAEALGGRLDNVLTVDFLKHGQELDEEVPAEIKKLLQIK